MAVVTLNFDVSNVEETTEKACEFLSETAAQRVREFLEGAFGGGHTLTLRVETNFGRCEVLSTNGRRDGKD